ncbi:MAG TPA: DnaJ domain-containing protein [Acidimicrobiales bacterium]|nr:DnaJ domain-containing protein [Acidimicrobiales bacterium]
MDRKISLDVTTHYDVLGISSDAKPDSIKRAYYKRARAYHPDAHAGSTAELLDEAERAMAAVNTAWNVLRDAKLRRDYDQSLIDAADAAHPAVRGRRKSRGTRSTPPQEILSSGFSYWMGGLGSNVNAHGERRVSLAVDGATSFSALKTLAPDRLWSLHAERSMIDDDELVNLQGMTELLHLDLSRTPVSDAGLLHLQGLDRLEVLQLWDTAITDAGLALLARLPNLVQLGLGNTRITDAGVPHLRRLERLRVLQLYGTGVTGKGLMQLRGMSIEMISVPLRVRGWQRQRLRRALGGAYVA